ncbi:hypothetical protein PVAP13_8KG274302 [Panicum virgatum]|uniref:Uncharacterized protein n=1 Tax=Panicum virgatum TaxID=38727 RepID=A0A8T0PV01_PANVG|nr:hypothetical protein PVAP13_8KG274302 [Panicum virgatum]
MAGGGNGGRGGVPGRREGSGGLGWGGMERGGAGTRDGEVKEGGEGLQRGARRGSSVLGSVWAEGRPWHGNGELRASRVRARPSIGARGRGGGTGEVGQLGQAGSGPGTAGGARRQRRQGRGTCSSGVVMALGRGAAGRQQGSEHGRARSSDAACAEKPGRGRERE